MLSQVTENWQKSDRVIILSQGGVSTWPRNWSNNSRFPDFMEIYKYKKCINEIRKIRRTHMNLKFAF